MHCNFPLQKFTARIEFIDAIHVVGCPLLSRQTTEPQKATPISSDQPSHMPRPQRVIDLDPSDFAY